VSKESPLTTPSGQTTKTTLEETIAQLESTLDATHDGILVLDLDRNIVRYNQQYLQMFRLTAEAVAERGAQAIIDAGAEQLEDADQMLLAPGPLWTDPSKEADDMLRFKDGRVYHRFVAPHRVGGRVIGRVASYRDISRTVRMAAALEQHREFLEKAQEMAHIGSWVAELDASDRLGWSTETYRIFGVSRDAFAGTSEAFFALIHDDDRAFVRRASDAAILEGQVYDVDHRIVRPGGEIRWVHERADIIRDANGKAIRMVGIVQDITERRLLEERVRQSHKLEAIGRLAGGIAHDLNNVLTEIVGYTELALGSLESRHPSRADVDEVRRAAERAEAVTRQLLAFSRKQLLERRVFCLGTTVASLGRLLARLLGSDVELHTRIADAALSIHGDSGQIEQAVINLAVNARDAMPAGGRLTLEVAPFACDNAFARAHQPMPPGDYIELSVSDTGQGMSEDTRAHVFEPFFTTKEAGKGTGLGLAIVYGAVRQSGGHIFVDSEIGRGTTFRIFFPAPAGRIEAPDLSAVRVPDAVTVLVVEDEVTVRTLVTTALTQHGYDVVSAASGEEALEIAGRGTGIGLLLTDVVMPGISGLDLARTLVRQKPGLPVIVMSGYMDQLMKEELSREPLPLLPKPFTPTQLRQKVAEVLGTDKGR
jgi:PAS domain S-box-containing protein